MNAHCNAGRAPVNGGALPGPILARLVEELFERVDFQKDSIDGLRETVHDRHVALDACRRERDSLEGALIHAARERDAAIHVAEVNARSGGVFAEKYGESLAEIEELRGVIGGAYVLATGVGSIHDIATTLAPYVPAPPPPADPRLDPAAVAGVDVQAEGVAYSLPPGFVLVGEMLPPGRYEGREHPGGFFEIDPAALPRDVFRSIFGLDRQPDELPDPATAQRQLGEIGAVMGSAAEPAPVPALSEDDRFILDAALMHGFTPGGVCGEVFSATETQVVALVKFARKQGRQDAAAKTLRIERPVDLARRIVEAANDCADVRTLFGFADRNRAINAICQVIRKSLAEARSA